MANSCKFSFFSKLRLIQRRFIVTNFKIEHHSSRGNILEIEALSRVAGSVTDSREVSLDEENLNDSEVPSASEKPG